jgi:hypothetical protein
METGAFEPSPRQQLLSKQGLAVAALAGHLLQATPGSRIETVQEQATRLGSSVGTIQAALDYLQSLGATEIESRGRLGSFVRQVEYPKLWELAYGRAIIGACPLPYARRVEGLASALRAQIRPPIELTLRFQRGSAQRLQALASRECDWALISRYAAEHASSFGFAIEPIALLGPESYIAAQVLLTRGNQPLEPGDTGLRAGMRVGVDPQSSDHLFLVRSLTRGQRVELVEIEYSQSLTLLDTGVIDATIWSAEALPPTLSSLRSVTLDQQREPALAALSEAAIVVAAGNDTMRHLLQALIDPAPLLQIQAEVVAGTRRPAY